MHLTRRQLLVGGLAAAALTSLAPVRAARRFGANDDDRVLVVVQLTGGNDGLNTVVPFAQDAYYRLRPSLSLAPGAVHRLDDQTALHPELGPLAELFAEGQLAVVQGVGYPDPDRSHFRSMQIWHTADPGTDYGGGVARPEAGWLGRLAAQLAGDEGGMPALHVGRGDLPLSLKTPRGFTPTVRDARGFRLAEPRTGFGAARNRMLAARAAEAQGFTAERRALHAAAASTYDAAARMEALLSDQGRADYPNHRLAEELALAAQLIAGGFGTRLFGLTLDGFDTHARQTQTHAALMRELGQSLAAFQRDLADKGVSDRVVTLVFSEFGRRVEENASKGTDHGAAGPVLVMGAPVAGGLRGGAPDLGELTAGDLAHSVDFRALYASLEKDWLGLQPGTTVAPFDGLLA